MEGKLNWCYTYFLLQNCNIVIESTMYWNQLKNVRQMIYKFINTLLIITFIETWTLQVLDLLAYFIVYIFYMVFKHVWPSFIIWSYKGFIFFCSFITSLSTFQSYKKNMIIKEKLSNSSFHLYYFLESKTLHFYALATQRNKIRKIKSDNYI